VYSLSNGTNINDREWPWRSLQLFETFLAPTPRGQNVAYISWDMFTHEPKSLCGYSIERRDAEWLSVSHAVTYTVYVTMSWNRCTTVSSLLQTTNRKWYMTCRIASAVSRNLEWRSRSVTNSSLFKCDFSYSCAAVEKISTNTERRAVPLHSCAVLHHCRWRAICLAWQVTC